jgi:LPS-assembly lipoprotein
MSAIGAAGAMRRSLLVLALAGVLAGCGFQLRGQQPLAALPQPVFVVGGSPRGMQRALQDRLRAADIRVADHAADAATRINIIREDRNQRVNAVNRDGKVIEYQLYYQVVYRVTEGGVDSDEQRVRLSRSLVNPDISVLGKQQELDLIYRDLTDDAASQILRRVIARDR